MVELSHEWGHGAPSMPGDDDVIMFRSVKHAQHGVMAQRLKMVMHSGTHMNTPIHLIQQGARTADIPLDHFFGNGVIWDIPEKRWELVTADDLAAAVPKIQSGNFVVIVTDWHRNYSDSLEYFGDSPGLSKDGAEWLVKNGCKLVTMDTPQIDHPLATSLGPHRGGPLMNRLTAKYNAFRRAFEDRIGNLSGVGGKMGKIESSRSWAKHQSQWSVSSRAKGLEARTYEDIINSCKMKASTQLELTSFKLL